VLLCLSTVFAAAVEPPSSPAPSAPACPENAVGLTLLDALRLSVLANLDIAQARTVVQQAAAARQRAQVLWLPNATFGSTYVDHEGRIQNTNGSIIDVNRNSLFVGGGPTISLGLNDALFAPGIATRILEAAQAGEGRVTNDTLFAVADAYFTVQRGIRRLARVDETLLYLTSKEQLAVLGGSKGLFPLLEDFFERGAASGAEVARAQVEVARRREEAATVVQELRFAMAELARLLRLDPRLLLWPLDDSRWATPIPGDAWLDCSVDDLIGFALVNRPDLAENLALVRAARGRVRLAFYRPLLPNLLTTYTAGGFGGSPNPIGRTTIMGLDGRIQNFSNRSDWDISLLWRLNNLGFGNLAEVREQEAFLAQAELRDLATRDRVVAQVVQAVALVEQTAERVRILQAGLFDARGDRQGPAYRSLRLNFTNVRQQQGRPLEVLDSIRGLNDTLEAYANALTEYERALFRLLVALGIPAPGLLDPSRMPVPHRTH
jgi:outer membrane protein TolC